MKLVKLSAKNKKKWWVLIHDLNLEKSLKEDFKPIHVFTLLAQNISNNKPKMFSLCHALENKLYAVPYHLNQLRGAMAKIGDPVYDGNFIKSYESHQEVIATTEAYLNAIYSALEITANINKILYNELPQSFSRQAKKVKIFSFEKNDWLKKFYDLRRELAHYNTLMIDSNNGSLIIKFTKASKLEYFKNRKVVYSIDIIEIYNFYCELIKTLNEWSLMELKKINKQDKIQLLYLGKRKKKLFSRKVETNELLKTMKSINLRDGIFGKKV